MNTRPESEKPSKVLAIDPGAYKCGVAILTTDGTVLRRQVLLPSELALFVRSALSDGSVSAIVLGNGTRSRDIAAQLTQAGISQEAIYFVDETNTTVEGKNRFFEHHPPRGWRRFVPRGLLTPDREYDDFAAVILAERYLRASHRNSSTTRR